MNQTVLHLWCQIFSQLTYISSYWNFVPWPVIMLLLLLSCFSRVRLCATPQTGEPTRLPRPWDSPGKNTGVGCHFLLQCLKVKSEREVAQSCPTLSDPMDHSPPGSSIHGIFQARVLEWGAIASPCDHVRRYIIWKISVTHEFFMKLIWFILKDCLLL